MAKTQATGASRFTSRYTDAQKDAILRAVLITGTTVAEAIKLAAAGQLGVPAFTVGIYAYDIVKKGRDGFEADHEEALNLAVANELKAAELDALANIRTIRRGLKRDVANDTSRLAAATRDLAQIRKARREANTAPRTSTKPQHSAKPDAYTGSETQHAVSVVADLLAKTQNSTAEGARTGSLDHARNATR
jgi:hypothetical protein